MASTDNAQGFIQVDRRRRVIVFADLVESVRLMQAHEADAIDRWRRFAATVRDQLLPARGGQLVRTAGDGLLMAFERAPAAVAAAFAMHAGVDDVNEGRADDELMLLRIGIHVAEAVFDEHEAYGAGVNLAARLASLAKPHGTVVSAEVRDELVDALHADIEDLGLRFVKHLKQPVRAFSVLPVGTSAPGPQPPLPSTDDLRPAIAVVPFSAMPADPAHDALGHAVADDVIAALARHPGLRVLSRATTGTLRDIALEPERLQHLRNVLDATYLLTGRYYVHGSRVRLSVELCSLPDGEVQWSGTAMAEIDALFAGQDDLVPHIVSNVGQRVLAHELARVRSLPMTTLASYSLFLGATGLMNSLVLADFMRAREVLDHLVERHPRQAAPYAMLARWHVFRAAQGWARDRREESLAARDHAQHAIDIDPNQAVALSALALARLNFDHDVEGARQDNLRAIEADPLDPHAWAQISAVHSFAGNHAAAQDAAARALSISPLDPCRYLFESYAAMAALAAARHDEAVAHARASVRHHALHAPSQRLLVGALWLDGRHDDAREAARRYLSAYPEAHAAAPSARPFGQHEQWRERFQSALLAAGVPA